jgi:hypothetical protein
MVNNCHPPHLGCDQLERLQPFAGNRGLKTVEPSDISAWVFDTNPLPTGSDAWVKTIGMVLVTGIKAETAGLA